MTTEPGDAARILVVDDERVIREILAEFLTLEGFSVHTVEDGDKALVELRLRPYDLLITDLKMPRLSGLQLLERIEAERLGVLTVLMTGFGTVETAIEAMKTECNVPSPASGVVRAVYIRERQQVAPGMPIIALEPSARQTTVGG